MSLPAICSGLSRSRSRPWTSRRRRRFVASFAARGAARARSVLVWETEGRYPRWVAPRASSRLIVDGSRPPAERSPEHPVRSGPTPRSPRVRTTTDTGPPGRPREWGSPHQPRGTQPDPTAARHPRAHTRPQPRTQPGSPARTRTGPDSRSSPDPYTPPHNSRCCVTPLNPPCALWHFGA